MLAALALPLCLDGCGQSRRAAQGSTKSGAAGSTAGGGAGSSAAAAGGAGGLVGTASGGVSGSGGSSSGNPAQGGTAPALGGSSGTTTAVAGSGGSPVVHTPLRGAPLVFAPTASGFGVSAVTDTADPNELRLHVRAQGAADYGAPLAPEVRAADLAEWHVTGLVAGTRYEFEVTTGDFGVAAGAAGQAGEAGAAAVVAETVLFDGRAMTERPPGASYTFALLSDTHIGSDFTFTNQGDPAVMAETSSEIEASGADFVVNLGDMLDYHEYGFNTPPPDSSIAKAAYLNLRDTYGPTIGNMAHFAVLGGWDSENGCNTIDEVNRSRDIRLLYLPGPQPETYPEGGSPFEDYYAFTWGDALFVVLNVYSYTPGCHLLSTYPGLPDDWTLGDAQLEWLRQTLENATSKWRFLLIHHPVGGNGGDDVDSAYGRGGGRAAHVGEQELVHELMLEYGVQAFFYGHDHVFTDMVVDGIHYSLPGSAGAPWFFSDAETGYTEYWADSGWARVDVSPEQVHVQFIQNGGPPLLDYTLQ